MSLTLIPATLPAGTTHVIQQPEPGAYRFVYDPEQIPRVTEAELAADRATLARIEATLGVAR